MLNIKVKINSANMNILNIKGIVILLMILGLSKTTEIFGQEVSEPIIIEKPNSILFSPFNLLDPINPSIQLGYERALNPKWALQIEGGYIINKGLLNILLNPKEGADEYSNKGHKLRFEVKRTLVSKKLFRLYSSCELFYLKNVSDVINQFVVSDPSYNYSFGTPPNDESYYDDYFTNDKSKWGMNIKGGTKALIGPVFLEAYLGLGVALRNNIHSNRENINDKSLDESLFNNNLQGKMWILNIPLNLKIGYRF